MLTKPKPKLDTALLDIYTDYLISSFSYTTATGLSKALDGSISHDVFTRFLSADDYGSKDLWNLVKPQIRQIQNDEGILIVDDTIEEKRYTDPNEIITSHFDHTFGRYVTGVNIISLLYTCSKGARDITLPVAFQTIHKTDKYIDKKTHKEKLKSVKTKNEYVREMLSVVVVDNKIPTRWIVGDTYFSSSETLEHIHYQLHDHFVMPVKSNRLVSLIKPKKGIKTSYQQIDQVVTIEQEPTRIYLKDCSVPVSCIKQVFTNEDGSTGILYLITNDLTIDRQTIMDVYQKRWHIEEYHKSIKSNTGLNKSPTKTVRTQSNHFFASIYAYCKLELLKLKTKLNHFALKSKLYLTAIQASMQHLHEVQRLALRR